MALSLPGERSVAAASPVNPIAALVRWIVKARAARTRRVALTGLLELEHHRLADLGISRQDVLDALARKDTGRSLGSVRARNARP